MPYIGVSPFNGVRKKHTYTATASQTSFSGAGTEGITLSYKDSTFVDVYQNGVKLGEADYTSTSGTAIVLGTGASLNDLVEVVVYDVFSVADTVSKADGGTFDGNVTMGGTLAVTGETTLATHLNLGDGDIIKLGASADLQIQHDGSDSKITDGGTGNLVLDSDGTEVRVMNGAEFMGRFQNNDAVKLFFNNSKKFETTSSGVTVTGGVTTTTASSLEGGAVFNESSADVDFRVESNGDANMLFVNGGSDAVGIGTVNVPSNKNTVTPSLNVSGSGVKGAAQITRHTSVGGGGALLHLAGTRGTDVNSYTILQDGDGIGTIAFQASDGNEFVTAAQIVAKVDGTPGDNDMPGELTFSCTKDGASSVSEYFRLKSNGRLEAQSVSNDGNVLQQFRIDWRNENNAGIMAAIGAVRTDNANAPGAFVIRTSTNVDSSSNSGDGEISEKFRVAANGDLTATDTSIASNSDSRLKENISDFAYDLDKFKSLKTKTFDWKNPKLHGEKSGQRGFIAQDIETVDNYWIEEIEVLADSDDFQYLEDKNILYTENSTIPVYEEGDTIPDGKKVGDAKYSVGDLEYKARFAKTSKLGQKDAMYVSIIQQLITKIETLETKVAKLEG